MPNLMFVVLKDLGGYKVDVATVSCVFLPTGTEIVTNFFFTEPNPVRRSLISAFKTVLSAVALNNGREGRIRHQ